MDAAATGRGRLAAQCRKHAFAPPTRFRPRNGVPETTVLPAQRPDRRPWRAELASGSSVAGDDPVNATDPNGNMALKSDDLNALVNEGVSPSSIGSISSADEFTTEADGRSVFTPIDYLFNYQFGGSCRFWIGTACNKPRQADLQDALIATATIGEYVVWNELWNSPGRFPAGPGDCPGLVDLDGQSESDVPNGFPCFVANEVAPYIFTTFDTITSDASTKWLIDKLAGQGLGIGDETDFVEGMEEIPEIAEPILSFVAASYVTKTGSGGIYCD